MSNNVQKREVNYYGGKDEPSITVTVNVYGHDVLQPAETRLAADKLASDVMLAVQQSPYTKAQLSTIKVERRRA